MRGDQIVRWAQDLLLVNDEPVDLWNYQRRALADFSLRKQLWWGRRTGKTFTAAIETLFWAFNPDEWSGNNLKILVLCPQKMHVECFFDRLRTFISDSGLDSAVERNKRGSPQVLEIKIPGRTEICRIVGFANSRLAARGQDADLIVLDEADYQEDGVLEIALPILFTHSKTRLLSAGTPIRPNSRTMGSFRNSPDFSNHLVMSQARPDWDEIGPQIMKDVGEDSEFWKRNICAYLN